MAGDSQGNGRFGGGGMGGTGGGSVGGFNNPRFGGGGMGGTGGGNVDGFSNPRFPGGMSGTGGGNAGGFSNPRFQGGMGGTGGGHVGGNNGNHDDNDHDGQQQRTPKHATADTPITVGSIQGTTQGNEIYNAISAGSLSDLDVRNVEFPNSKDPSKKENAAAFRFRLTEHDGGKPISGEEVKKKLIAAGISENDISVDGDFVAVKATAFARRNSAGEIVVDPGLLDKVHAGLAGLYPKSSQAASTSTSKPHADAPEVSRADLESKLTEYNEALRTHGQKQLTKEEMKEIVDRNMANNGQGAVKELDRLKTGIDLLNDDSIATDKASQAKLNALNGHLFNLGDKHTKVNKQDYSAAFDEMATLDADSKRFKELAHNVSEEGKSHKPYDRSFKELDTAALTSQNGKAEEPKSSKFVGDDIGIPGDKKNLDGSYTPDSFSTPTKGNDDIGLPGSVKQPDGSYTFADMLKADGYDHSKAQSLTTHDKGFSGPSGVVPEGKQTVGAPEKGQDTPQLG